MLRPNEGRIGYPDRSRQGHLIDPIEKPHISQNQGYVGHPRYNVLISHCHPPKPVGSPWSDAILLRNNLRPKNFMLSSPPKGVDQMRRRNASYFLVGMLLCLEIPVVAQNALPKLAVLDRAGMERLEAEGVRSSSTFCGSVRTFLSSRRTRGPQHSFHPLGITAWLRMRTSRRCKARLATNLSTRWSATFL